MFIRMNTWVITRPVYIDDHEIRRRVHRSFSAERDALEAFYGEYMKEVLARNVYGSFGFLGRLECYGPDIVDAIDQRPLHVHAEVTRKELGEFVFADEKHRKLQVEMMRFYRLSDAYVKKMTPNRSIKLVQVDNVPHDKSHLLVSPK